MNTTTPILSVEGLCVSYGSATVVQDLSFTLAKGQTLGIVGTSGSGKSTVALAIPGLLPNQAILSGQFCWDADPPISFSELAAVQKIRLQSGVVFQDALHALNPLHTCGQQLVEALLVKKKMPISQAKTLALEWLTRVELKDPERIFQSYPFQVSGGQLQRVLIALALCHQPKLLIADEPTTALDAEVQLQLLYLLKSIQQELGCSLLFISHDLQVVEYMADQVAIMDQGRIVEMGPTEPIIARPQSNMGLQLQAASLMTSRALALQEQKPLFQLPPITVEYTKKNSFWKRSEQFKAVDQVQVNLWRGACLGIVGASGSGKSSLAKAIFQKAGGATSKTGLITQHPKSSLTPHQTIGNAIAEVILRHRLADSNAAAKKQAIQLLELVELGAEFAERLPHQLSGGELQRAVIARVLALQPQLLICDEITTALDSVHQRAILDLLATLNQTKQLSMVLIAHDLSVVRYLCQHTMVLDQGKIVEEGPTELLLSQPAHPATQRLIESSFFA
ncbi:MAG: ATP-binding cassette domain-containing protein [Chitinophagales bacterium]|jgi:ABC-type glutathione transport system ATPase component